jgi:hypothetical protein
MLAKRGMDLSQVVIYLPAHIKSSSKRKWFGDKLHGAEREQVGVDMCCG